MLDIVNGSRNGRAGYYPLKDLPQRGRVSDITVSTGWPELDELWRLYPGQFTMVTGVAGHGKSTFLLNVVCNVARSHGMRSLLYAPENEGHIRGKLADIWGDVPGFDRFVAEQCFVQSAQPEHYDDVPKTLPWVLDQAVYAVERDGVELVLIDPWNELERAKPKDQLLSDYIGQCLMWLKQFCRTYRVAVMLVAHPTKAGVEQGKVPGLADIEGSMHWFNKCDNGLIIARDSKTPTCRVISAKAREAGSGRRGECYFTVDETTGLFTPQYGATL